MTDRRPALSRVRGLGSARAGTAHWWAQRATALALVPLSLWLVASLAAGAGGDHRAVAAWLADPLAAIPMLLAIVAVFHHAQLGLQVVVEDYVQAEGPRIAAILLVKFVAAALSVAAAFAVLKLAFQG